MPALPARTAKPLLREETFIAAPWAGEPNTPRASTRLLEQNHGAVECAIQWGPATPSPPFPCFEAKNRGDASPGPKISLSQANRALHPDVCCTLHHCRLVTLRTEALAVDFSSLSSARGPTNGCESGVVVPYRMLCAV